MNAAAPSCRVRTKRTELSRSASISSRFSSPGIPKAKRTPSFSKQETRSAAAFMRTGLAGDDLWRAEDAPESAHGQVGPSPSGTYFSRPRFFGIHGDARRRPGSGHAAPVEGALDPMEDEGPRPRGGAGLETGASTRGRDQPLPKGTGAPFPTRPARPAGDRTGGLLQMAGSPLGAREPRRHRISRGGRDPLSDAGPDFGVLAETELLPRVHREDRGRGVPTRRRPRDGGSVPPLRVPAGESAVLPHDPRNRR